MFASMHVAVIDVVVGHRHCYVIDYRPVLSYYCLGGALSVLCYRPRRSIAVAAWTFLVLRRKGAGAL